MFKLFSKYSLEARVFPTILGLLPFYIFQYYYLNNFLNLEILNSKIIGNLSLSLVMLYFFAEFIIRYFGKLYEDKVFKNKLDFPSTNFLMHSNREYSVDFKSQLRAKIKNDFSLELLDKPEEEENDKEARTRIKEIVGLMISKVKDGHLVLKQNIAYGFVRNLLPASVIGVILSFLLIMLSSKNNDFVFYLGIIMIALYTVYLLCGKQIIDYFSKNYARKLIEEYYKS
jgi:hypothetical protein